MRLSLAVGPNAFVSLAYSANGGIFEARYIPKHSANNRSSGPLYSFSHIIKVAYAFLDMIASSVANMRMGK